jgi:hypothetical protein
MESGAVEGEPAGPSLVPGTAARAEELIVQLTLVQAVPLPDQAHCPPSSAGSTEDTQGCPLPLRCDSGASNLPVPRALYVLLATQTLCPELGPSGT